MANLIRFAKSGSDWNENELIGYNITISYLSPGEFFPERILDYGGKLLAVDNRLRVTEPK